MSAAAAAASPKAAMDPATSPNKSSKAGRSPSPSGDEAPHMFEDIDEMRIRYAQQFAELRGLLTLPCEDDFTIYRFLRGHKFNVSVAAQHLNATLAWRKEHRLDEVRAKAEKLTQQQYPFAEKVLAVHPHNINHGFDKSGQPLSIERLGHANPYMMVRTVKFDEMLAYHFHHMEAKGSLVAKISRERGQVVRTAKIMDLSGLGRHHLDRRGLIYFKKLVDMSQNAYPEMLGKLYVVNTPWIFSMGWTIVKPWLNAQTLAKIHILGNDNFLEKLKEDIDVANIPEFLGGQCTCGGTGCVPLVDPDREMTEQQISARGKYEHVVKIDAAFLDKLRASSMAEAQQLAESEAGAAGASGGGGVTFAGCTVAYEFRTKKHDIALEIRATTGGVTKVLKASKRYESDQDTIGGSFLIREPTHLTFAWDNGFSYFTGKTLLWRIDTDAAVTRAQEDADEEGINAAMSEMAARGEPVFSPIASPEEE